MFSRPRVPLTSKNDNPVLPQLGPLRMSQLNDLSISGCPAYPAAELGSVLQWFLGSIPSSSDRGGNHVLPGTCSSLPERQLKALLEPL